MFDIDFFMKYREGDPEIYRNKVPVVYNIETTNACNMKCRMCPRTTMMTRPIETMDIGLFKEIVSQLKPHTPKKWQEWGKFCRDKYGIDNEAMSENHFFLYIIPRVIQLHGYGDPLLDKNMGECVKFLSYAGLDSYFSCNPANIDVKKTIEMFENGLTYIKYSIESTDDKIHKILRGDKSDFTRSYKNILNILDIKDEWNLKTNIVITMLDLNRPGQDAEFEELKMLFQDRDVYIYFKSQDTQWLNKDYHGTNSIHWSEPCKHPWMSMTIKSNGEATQCMEDFNNAIVLGDTKQESLYDIWNGEKYEQLRQSHLYPKSGIQCTDNCDMTLIGDK
jgi:MoaA/NifB/PqqE/SkfB family radical SAM enzyme